MPGEHAGPDCTAKGSVQRGGRGMMDCLRGSGLRKTKTHAHAQGRHAARDTHNEKLSLLAAHFIAASVPPEVVHALLLVAGRGSPREASIQHQRGKRFHHMLEVRLQFVPGRALVREQEGLTPANQRARTHTNGSHKTQRLGTRRKALRAAAGVKWWTRARNKNTAWHAKGVGNRERPLGTGWMTRNTQQETTVAAPARR